MPSVDLGRTGLREVGQQDGLSHVASKRFRRLPRPAREKSCISSITHHLSGAGVGLTDAHLMASARLKVQMDEIGQLSQFPSESPPSTGSTKGSN